MGSSDLVRRRIEDNVATMSALLASPCVDQAAEVAARIVASLQTGGRVVFFGNGGSSMDAGHLAAELLGRFYLDREPLAAVSLPDATASVTAIGNDFGYDDVFARQLRGLCRPGDVAVALTTSGNSPNVLRALEAARELGVVTVLLTGAGGGRAAALADVAVCVPVEDTPRVQEACMHLGHTICELVEAAMAAPGHPPSEADAGGGRTDGAAGVR